MNPLHPQRCASIGLVVGLSACFIGPDDIAARQRLVARAHSSPASTPSDGTTTDTASPGDSAAPEDSAVPDDTAYTHPAFPTTVTVPAGAFEMGSPTHEIGRQGDEPLHTVTITVDLEVGRTEVTDASFSEWMDRSLEDPTCPDCPRANLTWHDAAAYTVALSEADDRSPCYTCTAGDSPVCSAVADILTCDGWRLPTEAEWEYIARGGTTGAFPSGASLTRLPDYDTCEEAVLDDGGTLSETTWYCASSGGSAQPVGQLEPNGFGLYDVSGNLWEWCHDGPRTYPSSGNSTDPVGPTTTGGRVLRGGSHTAFAGYVRLATRKSADPLEALPTRGFRVVRAHR